MVKDRIDVGLSHNLLVNLQIQMIRDGLATSKEVTTETKYV